MADKPEHRLASIERSLALEIRSWKFGFVVTEGGKILEWGASRFVPGSVTVAVRRLGLLLKAYSPSMVITRRTRRAKHGSSRRATLLIQRFGKELKLRSVPFSVVDRADVRNFFKQRGCNNKNGVAQLVAEHFERLKHRIPNARKPWDPERNMVIIFDAAATLIAFDGLGAALP